MARVLIFATTLFAIVFPVATFAAGVLRPHPGNPRYFTDDSGKPVYLTGSHTWPNLVERNTNTNPEREPFDFTRYVKFAREHKHNFIRLWSRHLFRYEGGPQESRCYGTDILYSAPLPWPRTGSGTALDGNPRFDLNAFDDKYFRRLLDRVSAAHERGIYVSVMLFGGRVERSPQCWRGNPFNSANNNNGIDGDSNGDGAGDTQQLPLPTGVDTIQKAYIRKVIDTVGTFDNVLFEVSNESTSDSAAWQYEIIRYIKAYQTGRLDGTVRKPHSVGITAFYDTANGLLMSSPADWISPGSGPSDPYFEDSPAADGSKVSILDSDHIFFDEPFNDPVAGRNWVWKSFMRGHNPILMENIFADSSGRAFNETLDDPGYRAARMALVQTRDYANRIDLARMVPRGELTSTGYALANPDSEYLVYQPDPSSQTVSISLPAGTYSYQWLELASGMFFAGELMATQAPTVLCMPFTGAAVLHVVMTEDRS